LECSKMGWPFFGFPGQVCSLRSVCEQNSLELLLSILSEMQGRGPRESHALGSLLIASERSLMAP
jgi:hypothetical protein